MGQSSALPHSAYCSGDYFRAVVSDQFSVGLSVVFRSEHSERSPWPPIAFGALTTDH
jgi:hypothetical protein